MCSSAQWIIAYSDIFLLGAQQTSKENGIKFAQEKTSYYEHERIICAKLKMLGLLLGLQSGYTKFLFFRLCAYWIAELDSNLYNKKTGM